MRLLIILAVILSYSSASQTTFDGYKVYRLQPTTSGHVSFLKSFEDIPDIDFWTEPRAHGIPVDIMVAPNSQKIFESKLMLAGIKHEIYIEDVQKLVERTYPKSESIRAGMTWDKYYTLDDIYSWIDSLPKSYPKQASVSSIGTTYENRAIKALKISFGTTSRSVVIEGGIHAREWITPATTTYLINEILNGTDPVWKSIAQKFDWYIVPVINPDGYDYTHKSYRLWRKNRYPFTSCVGADINRNFEAHWGEAGTSSSSCSETYGGPKAFSELESQAISKLVSSNAKTMKVFISFHSYSQILLLPYGHTSAHLDNYDDAIAVSKKSIEALAKRYGTQYKTGNVAEILYDASGTTMDWVKNATQVPLAYTYEMRDTGKTGFLLPPEQIIPNCLEIMDSLVAMFQKAEEMNLLN